MPPSSASACEASACIPHTCLSPSIPPSLPSSLPPSLSFSLSLSLPPFLRAHATANPRTDGGRNPRSTPHPNRNRPSKSHHHRIWGGLGRAHPEGGGKGLGQKSMVSGTVCMPLQALDTAKPETDAGGGLSLALSVCVSLPVALSRARSLSFSLSLSSSLSFALRRSLSRAPGPTLNLVLALSLALHRSLTRARALVPCACPSSR